MGICVDDQMETIDIDSLPEFVWIKNPKGLVVEVAKQKGPELLRQGAKIVSDVEGVKEEQKQIPKVKSNRTYLNVEEL